MNHIITKESTKSINKIHNKYISTQIANWKHLWKLKLPSSTSFWVWRLEHKKIKLGNNIEQFVICPFCKQQNSTEHLLFDCQNYSIQINNQLIQCFNKYLITTNNNSTNNFQITIQHFKSPLNIQSKYSYFTIIIYINLHQIWKQFVHSVLSNKLQQTIPNTIKEVTKKIALIQNSKLNRITQTIFSFLNN